MTTRAERRAEHERRTAAKAARRRAWTKAIPPVDRATIPPIPEQEVTPCQPKSKHKQQ
jgi:hypothetical protein